MNLLNSTGIKILALIIAIAVGAALFLTNHKSANAPSENVKSEDPMTDGPLGGPDLISEANNALSSKTMQISSTAFESGQSIPAKYTCDGNNINPPLSFSDLPEGTKSLVLISDDPDAPSGTWVHWTLWNITPDISEIREGSVPEGATAGQTSWGKPGYGGPCPPSGTHRYFFKLYALDTNLDLGSDADIDMLQGAMEGHVLEHAEVMGTYERQ